MKKIVFILTILLLGALLFLGIQENNNFKNPQANESLNSTPQDFEVLNQKAVAAQELIINEFSSNYSNQIELLFSENNNLFGIETILIDNNLTFDELKIEFKERIFLTQKNEVMSNYVIESIINKLFALSKDGKKDENNYYYSLDKSEEKKQAFLQQLKNAFEKQATEKDWLYLECEEYACLEGKGGDYFKFILPFDLIDENSILPQITVTNLNTQEFVKINIIPKKEITLKINSNIFKKIYINSKN